MLESGTSDSGALTLDEGGDLTVRTLSSTGKVLSSVTVTSNIVPILAPKPGTTAATSYSFTSIPIFASLPYDASARTIQILKNSIVIANQSVNQLTLAQVIAAIPNAGFKSNPILARIVLVLEADAVQKAITKNQTQLALSELSLLMSELALILKDNYAITDQDQLTKAQVLSDLTEIAGRLK